MLKRSVRLTSLAFVLITLMGIGLRLIDLQEPPLDYHPTRQLRAALITRGLYYQLLPSPDPATRDLAIDLKEGQWAGEPSIFETLVALSYLIAGGEYLWISRLWGILFWLAGGVFLFKAAQRLTDESGALVTLAYFWILPFGVYASRSFQPDVLFVPALAFAAYACLRWASERTAIWTVAVGLGSGLAILIKGQHAPIVAGMILGVFLACETDLRDLLRNRQAWAIVGIAAAIPAGYYFSSLGPDATGRLSEYSLSVIGSLLEPSFYVRWAVFIDNLVYLGFALLGLAAIAFLPRVGRGLALGLWFGYVFYGLLFSYLIRTHDYYSLPLVPIVAFSLAPVGAALAPKISQLARRWQLFVAGVSLLSILYPAWIARSGILGTDYSSEPLGWIKMGRQLPKQGSIIGLTHDYGARIAYYGWRRVGIWPTSADFEFSALQGRNQAASFEQEFDDRTQNYDYFLVTLFNELDKQPELAEKLYDDYPIAIDGDGYLLFDLTTAKPE